MEFKNWIVSEYNQNNIAQFIYEIKQYVLNHIEIDDYQAKIHFPKFAQQQLRLVAWTDYLESANRGVAAQKNLLKLNPSINWTPNQSKYFQSAINEIQVLPGPMGLLFEIFVYKNIMSNGIKSLDDQNVINLHEKKNKGEIIGKISNHYRSKSPLLINDDLTNKTAEMIFEFINEHAKDIANKIMTKTKQTIKCIDQIKFSGGTAKVSTTERDDPSDIILSCSKKSIGWNLKFGTSTRVKLALLSPKKTVYEMARLAGLSDYKQRYKLMDEIHKDFENDPFKTEDETVEKRMIDYVSDVSKAYENNPIGFTNLLNYLIHNNENKSLLAIRNYITSPNDVGYSGNFQEYFNINGAKLSPKEGAFVSVRESTAYIVLNYGLEHLKDKEGIQIFILPNYDKSLMFEFKVNNLTSDIIRKSSPKGKFISKKSDLPF